jgi:hypothetical protein
LRTGIRPGEKLLAAASEIVPEGPLLSPGSGVIEVVIGMERGVVPAGRGVDCSEAPKK